VPFATCALPRRYTPHTAVHGSNGSDLVSAITPTALVVRWITPHILYTVALPRFALLLVAAVAAFLRTHCASYTLHRLQRYLYATHLHTFYHYTPRLWTYAPLHCRLLTYLTHWHATCTPTLLLVCGSVIPTPLTCDYRTDHHRFRAARVTHSPLDSLDRALRATDAPHALLPQLALHGLCRALPRRSNALPRLRTFYAPHGSTPPAFCVTHHAAPRRVRIPHAATHADYALPLPLHCTHCLDYAPCDSALYRLPVLYRVYRIANVVRIVCAYGPADRLPRCLHARYLCIRLVGFITLLDMPCPTLPATHTFTPHRTYLLLPDLPPSAALWIVRIRCAVAVCARFTRLLPFAACNRLRTFCRLRAAAMTLTRFYVVPLFGATARSAGCVVRIRLRDRTRARAACTRTHLVAHVTAFTCTLRCIHRLLFYVVFFAVHTARMLPAAACMIVAFTTAHAV